MDTKWVSSLCTLTFECYCRSAQQLCVVRYAAHLQTSSMNTSFPSFCTFQFPLLIFCTPVDTSHHGLGVRHSSPQYWGTRNDCERQLLRRHQQATRKRKETRALRRGFLSQRYFRQLPGSLASKFTPFSSP